MCYDLLYNTLLYVIYNWSYS